MHPKYENFGSPEIKLIEECSELIQALTKIIRFGLTSVNPELPECEQVSNLVQAKAEIADVMFAIDNCLGHWSKTE